MAKLSDDGLELRLGRSATRKVIDVVDGGELERAREAERAGFSRRECIAGKHQVGTDPNCTSCSRYKAGAVVRKG